MHPGCAFIGKLNEAGAIFEEPLVLGVDLVNINGEVWLPEIIFQAVHLSSLVLRSANKYV
jgi:hypothetical protein